MPELPDVEVYRRYLESTLLHQPIEDVDPRDGRMLVGGRSSYYCPARQKLSRKQ